MTKSDNINNKIYKMIKKNPIKAPMQINHMLIEPTKDNYKVGYIERYFARQTNSELSNIVEIDEKVYSKLQTSSDGFYLTGKINWRISGNTETEVVDGILKPGVISSNKKALEELDVKFPGIVNAFGNLVKYYKK